MSVREIQIKASACCAHCRKPLPIVDGVIQRWRAPNGLLYCNEFCADDAEEAIFQNRGKSEAAMGRIT
jgi:hypothetical protein